MSGVNNTSDTKAASTGGATEATLADIDAKVATAANQVTGNASLTSLDGKIPDESGVWGYNAVVSGTVTLTGGKRMLGIAASAPSAAAGSMTINGGDSIVIPAGKSVQFEPLANLVNPTIVFTGTDSAIVEYVV